MDLLHRFIREKKETDPPKEIRAIFEKAFNIGQGATMVDKAISFRNLGQFDKAIELLRKTLKSYPSYLPAQIVLGVTLIKKGDIRVAEIYFKNLVSKHFNNKTGILIEAYANLGIIRLHYNDFEGALKYYDLALKEPNPRPDDHETFEFIRSSIYRDLCSLYFDQKNFVLAKQYALQRVRIIKDCPIASFVLGVCLLNEFLEQDQIVIAICNDIEPVNLKIAAELFLNCLKENDKDYSSVFGISLSLSFYLVWSGINHHPADKEMIERNHFYIRKLDALAQDSELAKQMLEEFFSVYSRIGNLVALEMAKKAV